MYLILLYILQTCVFCSQNVTALQGIYLLICLLFHVFLKLFVIAQEIRNEPHQDFLLSLASLLFYFLYSKGYKALFLNSAGVWIIDGVGGVLFTPHPDHCSYLLHKQHFTIKKKKSTNILSMLFNGINNS